MHEFVVLGLIFSVPSHEIGMGKHLRNGLFCVEWEVKPQGDMRCYFNVQSKAVMNQLNLPHKTNN